MNFYNKINKNILERFPTMWNTQFVWMILICLLTHVLYFGLGYAYINTAILKEYGVKNTFFDGTHFIFYFIIGLLALIFFGFRYFTHNPFKNFYPVSHTYFWKILGQLFVIFVLYGSVFISFENGMKLKAKKLIPLEIIQKEANQIAFAKPFLYNEISDYRITNRSYPEPFPCEEISDFVTGKDTLNDIDIRHNIDYKKPYITLNDNTYQFGKTRQVLIDSCNNKEVLDTIYDVSKIYGLAELSLYNYAGSKLGNNRKYINEPNIVQEEDDLELQKIHDLHKNKDSVGIAKKIQTVKDICTKYGIKEQLNPMKMATAGLKQDLNTQPLIRTGFQDYTNYTSDQIGMTGAAAGAVSNVDNDNSQLQIDYNYFADLPKFTTLQENVESLEEDMGTKQLNSFALWALIFGSLFAAFVLVMVKYIALKDLIIGVFVAGVLAAILGLYIALTERNSYGETESRIAGACLIYATIIICIGLYGIFSNAIKKVLLTKWFVAFGAATIAFFPLLLLYIREKSYKEVLQNCETYPTKIYAFEFEVWHFIGLALLSAFIIFIMLRKLYAKVE